jgi:hypothetical protein
MENNKESHEEITVQEIQNDTPEVIINNRKLEQYIEELKLEQNLGLGILGGLGAALIGAIAWAYITIITEFQIGYMAVAIGFIVGYTLRYLGKGMDTIFGVVGAVCALLGCLLGNFLSIIGFFAQAEGLSFFEALAMVDISIIPEIMIETAQIMDVLFYGIAIYEGYKFSFRVISEDEVFKNGTEPAENKFNFRR